jgi:hypothetical protein
MWWLPAAAALALFGARHGAAFDSAILQVQVLEGEGSIHTVGTRANRPFSVRVTDETGAPVEGAAVSFRLPEQETTGEFGGGSRHDVVVTGRDGRASVRSIQWNQFPGSIAIRVTAAKDQARAGTVINCFLAEGARSARSPRGEPTVRQPGRVPWKWIAVAGGGAAAGALAFGLGGKAAAATGQPTAAVPAPVVRVGAPTITVRQP